jgi:hypothetical protein
MLPDVERGASDPLNRFTMYVDVGRTMNNLNRESSITACRLSWALFHYRGDVKSLLPRDWGWRVRGGGWSFISVNCSQTLRPSGAKTRSFGKN